MRVPVEKIIPEDKAVEMMMDNKAVEKMMDDKAMKMMISAHNF